MDPLVQALIISLTTFLAASGGFWTYLKNRGKTKDEEEHNFTHLIMGLASIKIIELGMEYIGRGCITKDEYDELMRYLFKPYLALGGNGTAERVMHAVERLPLLGERFEKVGDTWQTIHIRESDPTGFRVTDLQYEGVDRRGRGKKSIGGEDTSSQ